MLQLGYINFLFFRKLVNQFTTIIVNSRPSKIICLLNGCLLTNTIPSNETLNWKIFYSIIATSGWKRDPFTGSLNHRNDLR